MDKLVNLRELGLFPKSRTVRQIYDDLRAKEVPVKLLTVGDLDRPKDGRLYIAGEDQERFLAWHAETFPPPRRAAALLPAAPADDSRYDELLAILLAAEDRMKEMAAQIDALHRCVGAMHTTYLGLRDQVDKAATLPDPPPLPPRHRFRILLAGGDSRLPRALEPQFPDVKFMQMEQGGNARHMQGQAIPRSADLVIIMTSFFGHSEEQRVRNVYPKERIIRVNGATSSAAAAITAWLVGQPGDPA